MTEIEATSAGTTPRLALRLAIYCRALATVAFLLGGGIAAVALWAGLGDAVGVLTSGLFEEGVVNRAAAAANVPVAVGGTVVGVLVWQVGSAAAFYWTFTRALDSETAETVPDEETTPGQTTREEEATDAEAGGDTPSDGV